MGSTTLQPETLIKMYKEEMDDLKKIIIDKIMIINKENYINHSNDFIKLVSLIRYNVRNLMNEEFEKIKNYVVKCGKTSTNEQILNIIGDEMQKLTNSIQNNSLFAYDPNQIMYLNYRNNLMKNYINFIQEKFLLNINEIDRIISIELEKKNIHSINKIPANSVEDENFQILSKNNVFLSQEIQNKYLEIITEFETNSMNYINDNDKIENKSIGEFLKSAANVIRKAYNDSHEFLKILYKEYNENKNKENFIISSIDIIKKEFSFWVKNNNKIIDNFLEKFLKNKNLSIKKIYLDKLYKELLILYYKSQLAFPSFEINFDFEPNGDFNSKTMIDYLNSGAKKRKVNFVIFPSLYSNGNYIRNGQQWVFTYINNNKKKTFYFDHLKLENLIEEEKKFKFQELKERLKLKIYIEPILNYNVSEGIKKEFIFYVRNKKTNKIEEIRNDSKIELKEDQEFVNCKLDLMDNITLYYIDNQKSK